MAYFFIIADEQTRVKSGANAPDEAEYLKGLFTMSGESSCLAIFTRTARLSPL